MTIEEAMVQWKRTSETAHGPGDEVVLARVQADARAFDAHIRARDRREIAAAAIVFVVFVWPLATGSWLTRAGALTAMVGCIMTVLLLRRGRTRHPPAAADQPLTVVLAAECARVDAQIRLLRSVLWWYVSPIAVGVILIFAGVAGLSWATLIYAVVTVLIGLGIALLNRSAASDLARGRAQLTRLQEQLGN